MKQKDDSTLSLFGDELPVSNLQDDDAARKKITKYSDRASNPR